MDISRSLELQLRAEVYRESFYEFFKWAFKILNPNDEYVEAPHVKFLCDRLEKEQRRIEKRIRKKKDIIINIPPRASKSVIVSQCLIGWVWIRLPQATFITVSFDEELALLNAQYSKDIIKSEDYQAMFGHIFQIRRDSDGKSMFTNDKGGFRMSRTTGQNITGHKGLWILIDDPQNPKTAESEGKRKETITYYNSSLYNRLTPVQIGCRVLVQQRLHIDDLTGNLLKNNAEKYEHICLPAEYDEKVVKPVEAKDFYRKGLLDPVRLDPATLKDFKKVLGERAYAGQYGQIPALEEGNIIKKEWMKMIALNSIIRDPKAEPIHFIIDSAYTSVKTNDPTAILVCYKRNNQLFILDSIQVWMDFPELLAFIPKYIAQFSYTSGSRIFVEPKAAGKSIVQQLKAITTLNIVESKPPTASKVERVHSITPELECGRVHLVEGSWNEGFIAECTQFPNGVHDDRVDTLVIAIQELLQSTGPDITWI